MNVTRRLLDFVFLTLAWLAQGSGLAFGPGHLPPGVETFSGGPIALDLVHDRIFLCDSANHRVLVYDISSGGLGSAPLAVIGQPDTRSTALNGTGEVTPNNRGLAFPDGIAYDAGRDGVWVGDFLNNRVLFFDTRRLTNYPRAEYVIGQKGFRVADAGAGRHNLSGPSGVALSADGKRLFVSDTLNHRVLVFEIELLSSGLAAFGVIGQRDFSAREPGTSAQSLSAPAGLAVDANDQLYVADSENNRVLLFNTLPLRLRHPSSSTIVRDADEALRLTNAALQSRFTPEADRGELVSVSAYAVFGQPDFESAESASGTGGLCCPTAIALDEVNQWMFVADAGNNRIVAYDGNAGDPMRARAIIGQPDPDACSPQPADKGLHDPVGLAIDIVESKLWVSESGNQRLGVYRLNDN
ncbi:MAG: NHL repeat-containing protein [Verrucomicrobiae bacterium]|nr:NHL repeat-containing protein [Verrucomicrobiae bacterium]